MVSKKESQFITKNVISDTDYIRTFTPGLNSAITFSDFKSSLGVTGSIEQVGDPLGAPVLYTSGDNYFIRNIESTKGVQANVSAQNGITLGLNIAQASTGIKLIDDLNAKQYQLKTIKAGADITITDEGDAIEINYSSQDSINDGLMWVQGSTTETVISGTGIKTKVNNVWTVGDVGRFTFDSTGRLTYTGEKPVRLPIDISTTMLTSAGGDKQAEMCVGINGSTIAATCKQGTVNSSKAASVSTIWQHEFVTGDYVEVFVSNESDTTNIIVQQAVVRIN